MAMLNFGGVQVMGWSSKYPFKKTYPETTWQPVASISLRWKCLLSFFDGAGPPWYLGWIHFLVGGWTNPSEKYDRQIGNLPQGSGWKVQKYLSCHQLDVGYFLFPLLLPWLQFLPSTNQKYRFNKTILSATVPSGKTHIAMENPPWMKMYFLLEKVSFQRSPC